MSRRHEPGGPHWPAWAGYYAVAYIRDALLSEAIDNAWSVRWRDACGALSFSILTAPGSAAVSGAISVDKPVSVSSRSATACEWNAMPLSA